MKLKRFHTDVYCPTWTRDSILKFAESLKGIKLVCSYHAKNKIRRMKKVYRQPVKDLISTVDMSNELYLDYVFEFYSNDNCEIKKVCYRFPMKDMDSDLIIVVSSSGKIVTMYLNNNFQGHFNLKRELYEREEQNEGTPSINAM